MLRTAIYTVFTLIAFAANSLLCRMALGARAIDPASFTSVRILSGAIVLAVLARISAREVPFWRAGSASAAGALFVYAIAFSFAYLWLNTATGALILFGSVQLTMFITAFVRGERLRFGQGAAIAVAAGGLIYLLAPGVTAPSPLGAALMAAAGVAWGVYTLKGRGAANPLATTAGNFVRAVIPAVLCSAVFMSRFEATTRGVVLAAISGAITSGLGYALWYTALRGHSAMSAAVVQLAVPIIAACGGIVVLDETPTQRLFVSGALTLGGILASLLLAASHRKRADRP